MTRLRALERDVPLAPFTTYKLGGPARCFLTAEDVDDLEAAVDLLSTHPELPVLVLGRGSNLVVSDTGFPGLVVRPTGRLADIEADGDLVVAGGGAGQPQVARFAARRGRGGLEFMVGIPGTVGGAVAMNAGCFGRETADVLVRADVLDLRTGERRSVDPASLEMGYRRSRLGPDDLVVRAWFRTEADEREAIEARMREITRWRREHQPGGTFNAGSVFKNPPGDAAGRLIDAVGLKGFAVGDVAVSEKHANFFVAGPSATAADVRRLVEEVRRRVHEATGVHLEPELRFVGPFDEDVEVSPR